MTYIVVVTNTIHTIKCIFDTFIHLYQLYTIIISSNLSKFFDKNISNLISFQDCHSNNKQPLYLLINKRLKFYKINPISSSKISWEFRKKIGSIIKKQQMYFQVFDYNKRHFLNLNDNNKQFICPTYFKDKAQLKYFSLFNS